MTTSTFVIGFLLGAGSGGALVLLASVLFRGASPLYELPEKR